MSKNEQKGQSLVWMSVLYLLGLFIGAIDSGIITPARPIIQSQLGVDANLGIWMITIYTLTYAAIIPISGKLADKRGRKPIYLISIMLFGLGSVICALSHFAGSFLVLMIGRVVQAAGAGGIMPVATAEFSTSFPEEKRGMALGLVGAVYGIANVVGASFGSLILNIAGVNNWQWIFLVNVPICLFIAIAGVIKLPNNRADEIKAMDKIGTLLMTIIILAILYGLKNLDFFNFIDSFTTWKVWPFILGAALLIPLFAFVEKKAEDPIFHIEYVHNRQIMVTLVLSIIVGCSMMGMIFIPQFAENCLKMASGSGGYFVIILGLCAGASSMISGKMLDKRGAKFVLAIGFLTSIVGCLYLSFITTKFINIFNVVIALILIGFGLGLTMGTPLNYMMLENTTDEESNSALATLSLIRSIGTAVAPAIMVGFIVHASAGLQTELMNVLPKDISMPKLPYVQEINETLGKYKENPMFSKMMGDMEMPDLSNMGQMDMSSMSSGDSSFEMPAELLDEMQNSDVTTITDTTVKMVSTMFDQMTPPVIEKITTGIDAGINGINAGLEGMGKAMPAGMPAAAMGAMGSTMTDMKELLGQMEELKAAVPDAFATARDNYADAVRDMAPQIEDTYQATLNKGYRNMYLFLAAANAVGLAVLSLYKQKKTAPAD